MRKLLNRRFAIRRSIVSNRINVAIAFVILIVLIGVTPLTFLFDGPITYGCVTALVSIGLCGAALNIRPGEARALGKLVRPVGIFACILAILILLQTFPLGIFGLSHPIWQSAAQTLGQPIRGSISIDVGATLIALGRYLTSMGIALLATAIAFDRKQAAFVLYLLAAATAIIALMFSSSFIGLHLLDGHSILDLFAAARDSVALGAVLSTAVLLRMFGQQETSSQSTRYTTFGKFLKDFAAPILLIVICLVSALMLRAFYSVIFGLAVLISVVVIRRLSVGPWGYAAISAVLLVIFIATLALKLRTDMGEITIAFANAPPALTSVTTNMLADRRWLGTGAGTFSDLVPIYRDINGLGVNITPPTAAAAIVIELGTPIFWAIVISIMVLILSFLRATLHRGRDSVFPAAGAGCLTSLVILAFEDAGLFNSAVSTISAVAIGLAISQRKSRTELQ